MFRLPRGRRGCFRVALSCRPRPSGDAVLQDRGGPGPVHGPEQPEPRRGGGEGRRVVFPAVGGGVPAGLRWDTSRRIPGAL